MKLHNALSEGGTEAVHYENFSTVTAECPSEQARSWSEILPLW